MDFFETVMKKGQKCCNDHFVLTTGDLKQQNDYYDMNRPLSHQNKNLHIHLILRIVD